MCLFVQLPHNICEFLRASKVVTVMCQRRYYLSQGVYVFGSMRLSVCLQNNVKIVDRI